MSALTHGHSLSGSHSPISSTPSEGLVLHLSSLEEFDVLSIDAGESEDSPLQSPGYKELVEVVTCAVSRLNIDLPAER